MNRNLSPWQKAKALAESNSQRKIDSNGKQDVGDVVNQALANVRANADAHKAARKSPQKIYNGVKSKIAGNMKSIRKSQTNSFVKQATSSGKKDVLVDTSPYKQSVTTSTLTKTRGQSGTTRIVGASDFKKQYKSKLANDHMEAIVANIRSRLSQDKITNMTQQDLQSEVLSEINKTKVKTGKTSKTMEKSMTSAGKYKNQMADDQVEDVGGYAKQSTYKTDYQDFEDDGDMKHDRREQILTSNAFDNMVERQTTASKQEFQPYSRLDKSGKKANGVTKSASFVAKSTRTKKETVIPGQINFIASAAQITRQRSPSPQRGLSPDINRALAREMYIESTVNVVSPGKNSPQKIRPGQMNLFNPKGQENLSVHHRAQKYMKQNEDENEDPTERSVDKIRSIFNDEGGKGKIRNENLQKKTEAIQDEFEQLMTEMVSRRSGTYSTQALTNLDDILDGYYMPGPERKHKSPTRRLIQHKNSITDHKTRVSNNLQRGDYSQIYSIGPGSTYVIEAQGGELPYEIAEQNPMKFYNRVLNQDIKKCKVKNYGRLSFTWTQRPLLKIINSIKDKLVRRLSVELGHQYEKDIQAALNNPEIQENLKEMVENREIELQDQEGSPFLQAHLQDLMKQQEGDEGEEHVDIRIESPSMNKLDKAELQVKEQRYSGLQADVKQYVRRNSLLKDAKNL